ncbi:hypothetical protein HYX19_05070, partial [Candidatus Woesearchaeota archaeon]|nr:hypothetical protein [Candidatus Woesearchaeota archaeon]
MKFKKELVFLIIFLTLINVNISISPETTVGCCRSNDQNPCAIGGPGICASENYIADCSSDLLCRRVCCSRTEGGVEYKYVLSKIDCDRRGGVSSDNIQQCQGATIGGPTYARCSDYGIARFENGNLIWEKIGNLREMVDNSNPRALHDNTCNPDALSVWKEGNDLVYFFVQGSNYGILKGQLTYGQLLQPNTPTNTINLPPQLVPPDVLLAYAAPNEPLPDVPDKFFVSKGDLYNVCDINGCSGLIPISGILHLQ